MRHQALRPDALDGLAHERLDEVGEPGGPEQVVHRAPAVAAEPRDGGGERGAEARVGADERERAPLPRLEPLNQLSRSRWRSPGSTTATPSSTTSSTRARSIPRQRLGNVSGTASDRRRGAIRWSRSNIGQRDSRPRQPDPTMPTSLSNHAAGLPVAARSAPTSAAGSVGRRRAGAPSSSTPIHQPWNTWSDCAGVGNRLRSRPCTTSSVRASRTIAARGRSSRTLRGPAGPRAHARSWRGQPPIVLGVHVDPGHLRELAQLGGHLGPRRQPAEGAAHRQLGERRVRLGRLVPLGQLPHVARDRLGRQHAGEHELEEHAAPFGLVHLQRVDTLGDARLLEHGLPPVAGLDEGRPRLLPEARAGAGAASCPTRGPRTARARFPACCGRDSPPAPSVSRSPAPRARGRDRAPAPAPGKPRPRRRPIASGPRTAGSPKPRKDRAWSSPGATVSPTRQAPTTRAEGRVRIRAHAHRVDRHGRRARLVERQDLAGEEPRVCDRRRRGAHAGGHASTSSTMRPAWIVDAMRTPSRCTRHGRRRRA